MPWDPTALRDARYVHAATGKKARSILHAWRIHDEWQTVSRGPLGPPPLTSATGEAAVAAAAAAKREEWPSRSADGGATGSASRGATRGAAGGDVASSATGGKTGDAGSRAALSVAHAAPPINRAKRRVSAVSEASSNPYARTYGHSAMHEDEEDDEGDELGMVYDAPRRKRRSPAKRARGGATDPATDASMADVA